jgi:endonuclease/exonuclease/phosphatase family metal-dependent hydrolase
VALAELAPDVLVVPEARVAALENRVDWRFEYQPNLSKGTGILIRNGWDVERLDSPTGLDRRWLCAARITPPDPELPSFVMLAFWALGSVRERLPSYAKQFADVLETWADAISKEPMVIAGDFNASARSKSTIHLNNVATATGLGLTSAYHAFHGVEHGAEKDMTLKWVGKGKIELTYHCDFVFIPSTWVTALTQVEVGAWGDWITSGRSDHTPVMVELSDAALRLQRPLAP